MSEDRTSEFFALASSLPCSSSVANIERNDPFGRNKSCLHSQPTSLTSNTSNLPSGGPPHEQAPEMKMSTLKREAYAELRSFHGTAAEISRDIASTSTMLSELTQLVRRRGLFMDDTERVNFLVLRIKESIENLNGRLDEVGKVISKQKRRLGNNSQAGQEASNLVGQLQEEFVRATTGFKSILQQRSDRLKEQNDRKKQVFGHSASSFGGSSSSEAAGLLSLGNKPGVYRHNSSGLTGPGGAPLPTLDLTSGLMKNAPNSSIPAGESTSSGSQLPRPRGVAGDPIPPPSGLRLRHSSSDNMYQNPSSHQPILTPLDIQRLEQQTGSEQQMQLIPDQSYLRERADAMETVETNIAELGNIFNKLAVMVNEHREMVQRVEDNVGDANENINLSLQTLTDTLTNLQTNRALFLKVFGVIVVFIIFFITFFA